MNRVKIAHGAEFDVLSRGDIDDALKAQDFGGSWFQEFARGVKPIRFMSAAPVSGGTITITGQSGPGLGGPEQGMTWAVRRLSCNSLGTGDVLKIFRNTTDDAGFIGTITAAAPRTGFGSTEFLLLPTDEIIVTGTGLTTTAAQLVVNGEGIEVPSFMVSKLL